MARSEHDDETTAGAPSTPSGTSGEEAGAADVPGGDARTPEPELDSVHRADAGAETVDGPERGQEPDDERVSGSEPDPESGPELESEADPGPGPEAGADPATARDPEGGVATAKSRDGRGRRRVVAAIGVFGELLITAGVILALFVVYSLWWTNVLADRDAKREGDSVRESWVGDKSPGNLDTKGGIGFLHAPSMSGSETLVKKGTEPEELNQGVAGYYDKPVKSAMPQDRSGNFSLAAHRDGHGAKFHNIDKMKKGDAVVFETKNTWFIYKVYATLPETSKYNVDVLDPVPKESGKDKKGRYITLTTCTPVYTSDYRYVVWGELERTEDVDAKRTPPKELRQGVSK